jgi:NADH dehydrogenase (ubiquinone) 1 alpha subcomplex subunit 8
MSASEVGPASRPPMANELYAAGRVIGNKCFDENLEFMKCKANKGEAPTACKQEGEQVHKCVYALYKDISAKAPSEFKAYAACLDNYDLQVPQCKKQQQAFEAAYYKGD